MAPPSAGSEEADVAVATAPEALSAKIASEIWCFFFGKNLKSACLSRGGERGAGRRGRSCCGGGHHPGCAERRDPGEAGEIRED